MRRFHRLLTLAGAIAAASAVTPALATEGALGRPITGLQGTSYAGLIPPTHGWSMGVSYAYYAGSFDAEAPLVGGGSAVGLDMTAQLFSLTGVYIWDTGEGPWNFASAVVLPFAKVDANADLRIGTVNASTSDSKRGLFDMAFVPVIASRHFSATRHMSLALYVFAPTGSFDPDRLANVSLNNWTFSPTVGYTQLFGEGTVEWSTLAAVDFYTENPATDYQNGAVFRVDSLLIKRFHNGWGIGAAGGWIEQLQDDTGPTAERFNGFEGRSLALGPIATYVRKWEGGQVEFAARWLREFEVTRRFQGDPIMLTATIVF